MDKLRSLWNKEKDKNEPEKDIEIYFGEKSEEQNLHLKASNKTRTAKYTWYSWFPLSILFQFTRAANIYFLIISILTAMPFSPKSPGSMIGTFTAVLIFTSLKELFEDIFRWISDREVNNAEAMVLNHSKERFEAKRWKDIQLGDIISVGKDETFPWDMLCIISRKEKVNVDTMNLDGETMLKPKKVVDQKVYDFIKGVNNVSVSLMEDVKNDRIEDDKGKRPSRAEGKIKKLCTKRQKLKKELITFEIIPVSKLFKIRCPKLSLTSYFWGLQRKVFIESLLFTYIPLAWIFSIIVPSSFVWITRWSTFLLCDPF